MPTPPRWLRPFGLTCDCGVPLGRCFEGHQRIGDGLVHLDRGAIGDQLGVGVGLALVDGRHHSDGDFGSREVIGEGRGDCVVRLLRGVRIAAEAQGPVVVGQLDAQGACGVEVADLVRAGQQVPGHVADPSGGVDQVGGDPVDGGLQGDLQVAEVSCRGEGPGVLEQQRSPDSLIHVGRGLPSGHVDGQLVHHALERIGGRHGCEGGVVGGSDAGVHRCCRRVVRQLEVHRGRRGLAVDLDLQGVQGGLVGLTGQAQGQTGVDSSEAGSVGRDEAFRCGEVRGQSVAGEVRSGQGGHLALERSDGGGVRADVRGVLRGGRVLSEDEAELPGGDALQLDHRRLRDAVVEDPPGEGGWEKTHLL